MKYLVLANWNTNKVVADKQPVDLSFLQEIYGSLWEQILNRVPSRLTTDCPQGYYYVQSHFDRGVEYRIYRNDAFPAF